MNSPAHSEFDLSLLKSLRLVEPHWLKGVVRIFGVSHHVNLIEMTWANDLQGVPETANEYVKEMHEDWQRLNEGVYLTVDVPGHPGKWAMVIYPFCE